MLTVLWSGVALGDPGAYPGRIEIGVGIRELPRDPGALDGLSAAARYFRGPFGLQAYAYRRVNPSPGDSKAAAVQVAAGAGAGDVVHVLVPQDDWHGGLVADWAVVGRKRRADGAPGPLWVGGLHVLAGLELRRGSYTVASAPEDPTTGTGGDRLEGTTSAYSDEWPDEYGCDPCVSDTPSFSFAVDVGNQLGPVVGIAVDGLKRGVWGLRFELRDRLSQEPTRGFEPDDDVLFRARHVVSFGVELVVGG